MTTARKWLERHTEAQLRPTMDALFMRDALLAVLDECDRMDSEEGEIEFTGIWYDALAHASDRIHDAIDNALGINDVERDDPMPWEEATWD